MALNRTILSLAACALAAALANQVHAQSNDGGAAKGDSEQLVQLEQQVAEIEAAVKRIEQLVAEERAKLRQSTTEFRKSNPKHDRSEKQAATTDVEKPAGGQEDAPTSADDAKLDSMEQYIVKYTNAYREKQGLPTLQLDANLCKASKDHSSDMKRLNFFSHQSPVSGKARFTDRAKRFDTTASGENIARGAQDGKSALGLWLNSQHHRENIVGDYQRIGVGRSEGFYTQLFGK